MILIDDLGAPEGPLLLPDGSWLVTELAPDRGCITRFDGTGKSRSVVARTGRPNGLALDDDGTVWVAESKQRAIVRLTLDGATSVATDASDGAPFLWPNDICVGPDGAVYLTDSGVLISDFLDEGRIVDGWDTLPLDGRVCRFDPQTGETTTLDAGILFTNGIAFGPDGFLYVNETMSGNVYRYRLEHGKVTGDRVLFGNVLDSARDVDGVCGPDGMAFDAKGNLYVTVFGQADITVLDPAGEVTRRIPTQGSSPTNAAFGSPGSERLHVVEVELGQMEVFDVGADGLALPGRLV